jgi:dTDP-glucose 4,6-dehydratase
MRHIITGGSGFTGSRLAATLLDKNETVEIFDLISPPDGLLGRCRFLQGDVRSKSDLAKIGFRSGDIVYHLAARQFHLAVPTRGRDEWFADVNVNGTERVLECMMARGADRLIFLSTDMVYGWPDKVPVAVAHPRRPLGPYGRSKLRAEDALVRAMNQGIRVTLFRPRLISGPGRLGILTNLFRLVRAGLPVPMIGAGKNRYQMIAVQDCVDAMLAAVEKNLPPGPFNLGSAESPTVRELLRGLIKYARSRSIVVPTHSATVKFVLAGLDRVGMTLLYPEQYLIADEDYRLDTSETTAWLDWQPKHRDMDMIRAAYDVFLASKGARLHHLPVN